jgi:hypothetical protein
VSVALWLAAILRQRGYRFLNRSGATGRIIITRLTIGLGMLASACRAVRGVLVQNGAGVGPGVSSHAHGSSRFTRSP